MIDPNHTMNLHAQTDERIASLNARIAELERKLVARTKTITQLQAELARAREIMDSIVSYARPIDYRFPDHSDMVAWLNRTAALAPTAETGNDLTTHIQD